MSESCEWNRICAEIMNSHGRSKIGNKAKKVSHLQQLSWLSIMRIQDFLVHSEQSVVTFTFGSQF